MREKLGLRQNQFAALVGISPRTHQNWEQGHRRPEGSRPRATPRRRVPSASGAGGAASVMDVNRSNLTRFTDPIQYREFKGNVSTVYANPLSKGGSGNRHYGGNAETYMNVGGAMDLAMIELLK